MTTRKRPARPRTDPVTDTATDESTDQVTDTQDTGQDTEVEGPGKATTVTVLSSSVTYRTQAGGRGIARTGDTITVPVEVAERLIAANAAK